MIRCFVGLFAMLFVFQAYAVECDLRRVGRYLPKDPDFRANYIEARYQGAVQQDTNLTLFRRKKDSNPVMDLARDYRVDVKNKKLIIKLKQNCGWSDGTIITAQHMLKGIQLVFDDVNSPLNRFGHLFKNAFEVGLENEDMFGVRVVDDFTLEFDLTISPDLLIQALAFPSFTPAPMHLMQKDSSVWPNKSIVRVSSGPYYATSMNDNMIAMKRNPYFCSSTSVTFDNVYYIGENDQSRWAKKVLLNEADVAHEIKPKQAAHIVNNMKYSGIQMGKHLEKTVIYLIIKLAGDEQKNYKVREAIKQTIDYIELNRITSNDTSEVPLHGIVPDYPGYQRKYEYRKLTRSHHLRMAKAKQIMQEMGYGPNNRLKINTLNTQGELGEMFKEAQSEIVSMLEQIYIDVEIERKLSINDHWNKIRTGDYEMAIVGWGPDIDDPSDYLEGVVNYFLPASELKIMVKSEIQQSYQIYDHDKRFAILANIEKSILDTNHIIPLVEKVSYYLVRPGFEYLDDTVMSARNVSKEGCPNTNQR